MFLFLGFIVLLAGAGAGYIFANEYNLSDKAEITAAIGACVVSPFAAMFSSINF